ncbi:hypothetical protein J6590_007126 [Homalodisca vitripennis]|nr:hypothetical protein J6590_007126 [Homalodisca vitripennis]
MVPNDRKHSAVPTVTLTAGFLLGDPPRLSHSYTDPRSAVNTLTKSSGCLLATSSDVHYHSVNQRSTIYGSKHPDSVSEVEEFCGRGSGSDAEKVQRRARACRYAADRYLVPHDSVSEVEEFCGRGSGSDAEKVQRRARACRYAADRYLVPHDSVSEVEEFCGRGSGSDVEKVQRRARACRYAADRYLVPHVRSTAQ